MSRAGPLDKDLPVPLYHQLQEVVRAQIESGIRRPGEQLPTEDELARQFGVSKITVRQALQNLAHLKYITRRHGRGTFVGHKKFDHGPRELLSFTEEMRRHGLEADSRILSQGTERAGASVAEALGVPERSLVFVLKRLRIAGGEPVTLQTAYIPAELAPALELTPGASLYEVLQRDYNLYAARARETYQAVAADAASAELLGIAPGDPVLSAKRVTLLSNDKPFEFVQSVIRGERSSIVLELVKDGPKGGLSLIGASLAAPVSPTQ
jgi:GntR family transcriptional regulator